MTTDAQFKAEERALRELLASGVEQELRALPNVFHVSVGLKEAARRLVTDRLCIRVYVRDKLPLDELAPGHRIPGEINGVPTDVNLVPSLDFQADNSRYRPIKGGIQISNGRFDVASPNTEPVAIAGTLGCLAIDKTDQDEMFLTNWHVLTARGGADGDAIFQPARIWYPNLFARPPALPHRLTADTDKVAVVRRTVISSKVDAGIARIDVSSCCHCCGIHFSNEIHRLSVSGTPPRSTIVGDEAATVAMTVFKAGAGTLRTEGRVVDINYPSFGIPHPTGTRTFAGQIAIQQVNTAVQFSDMGDSGAAVVNAANKIVGLVFAGGKNAPSVPAGFVTIANHISDVLSELNISIPYSSEVKETAGQALFDVPRIEEAKIPAPYRALRERMEQHGGTARIFGLGRQHADEILRLVNHCRPVTVAWHRAQGPALLATLMGAVRDGHYRIPAGVKGVALHEALERMREALAKHGSPALRGTMERREGDALIEATRGRCDLHEIIERLAAEGESGLPGGR
jgi:hypothetical protein